MGNALASHKDDSSDAATAGGLEWSGLRWGPDELRRRAVEALASIALGVSLDHVVLTRRGDRRRAEWRELGEEAAADASPAVGRAAEAAAAPRESAPGSTLHEASAAVVATLNRAAPAAGEQEGASCRARQDIAAAYGGAAGVSERKRDVRNVKGFAGKLARGELAHLMTVAQTIGKSVEFVGLAHSTRQGYWGSARTTEEYLCMRGDPDPKAWTFEKLSGFCVLFVLAGYKAKSLGNYLAAWRYCSTQEEYSLSEADYAHLQSVKKALVKITDQGDRDYAFPWLFEFTHRYAQCVTADARAKGELVALEDVQFLAAAALRGGCGARAGSSFGKELTRSNQSLFKLRKDGVVWTAQGVKRFVSVRIPKGKSALRWVHFEDDAASPHCTYRLLRNWFERSKMAGQADTAPFFPRIVGGALDWKMEQTLAQFLSKARAVATFLRLPADWVVRIRGHSWRAGFATDMLSRGVEVWKVKLMGGWKSECVLLYARITMATMAKWTTQMQSEKSELAMLPDLPEAASYLGDDFNELFSRSAARVPAGTERPADLPVWSAEGAGRPLLGPMEGSSPLPDGVVAEEQVRPPAFASLDAAVQR